MEIGDTLICKENIKYNLSKFILNNPYIIKQICAHDIYIKDCKKEIENVNNGLWFDLNRRGYIPERGIFYLWDYFYTKDELRLKKLNSL